MFRKTPGFRGFRVDHALRLVAFLFETLSADRTDAQGRRYGVEREVVAENHFMAFEGGITKRKLVAYYREF